MVSELEPRGLDAARFQAQQRAIRKAAGDAYEECVEIAELAGGYAMASCCKTVAQQIKKAISQHAAEAAKGEKT